VNPTDNKVSARSHADEIDTRKAIVAAKQAFNTFSQSSKEYGWSSCSGAHAVAKANGSTR